MRRFYTFKTMRGRKYLRVELLGRFINGPPDIGQYRVMDAVFNLIYQNDTIRYGSYGQNKPGNLGHAFAHC